MNVGTKSLLYGVHQFVWHPIFVLIGWWWLFGRPSMGEMVAIVIHDWGYWGKANMDDESGDTHPEWAAMFFERRGRQDLADLCRGHSRFWSKKNNVPLSKLCYADKLGSAMMPWWWWAAAARLTGEWEDYAEAEKHEFEEQGVNRGDAARWFRNWRYLVCQIIGEDLSKFKRSA